MKFKIPHHNYILEILKSLDPKLLLDCQAYFGGGTLLALDMKEYRWSKDIDLICSVTSQGYKKLRTHLYQTGDQGLFLNKNSSLTIRRATTDQYGVRLLVEINQVPIKLEIIAEVRFELDEPRFPPWSPVPCLSLNDCLTSKLLANADRYMDRSVESRDLIDLAVLRLHTGLSREAIAKAENAYEVLRPLGDAIKSFQTNPDYRQQCFESLQIKRDFWPDVIDGLDLLSADLELAPTTRTYWEERSPF
ncbi:nucleotidyl transferase AbiEii/AbiGii toxin family protein [Picosynechococcus sp. PCC 8807]|uniref:nucleotidyl transferase AbiEii/AbiGii toxin family protein n=1 Tax=Picosynechococcus sp. PCC 8807 TaxID=195248 RepID=UPI000810C070|nr:nucleotidyl transferase AbiEii/AbiGii toxin family protein [Picosynechococcus sp. PCC 8807]ANV90344.1 hypothetical protein AWQ24_06715 [Picosynechococcus sp. PCC 8807]